MKGTILLRDCTTRCIVGIHPRERESLQEIRMDAELVCEFGRAAAVDSVDYTVDYAAVADLLREVARRGKFQLLESLASACCDEILKRWPMVQRCTLRVKKPAAVPGAAFAGVELVKSR